MREVPITLLILRSTLAITLLLTATIYCQDGAEWSAYYPESYARETATRVVMPIYPEEAIQRGLAGVIKIKVAINSQGNVSRIRIRPPVDPLLSRAVADAVSQWTFDLRPGSEVAGNDSLSRLTFLFLLDGASGRVELYDPGPNAKDIDRIGYCDTHKELREWSKWEEVPFPKRETKF